MESRRAALVKRMATPGYASKTPEGVQAEDAERLAKLEGELAAVLSHTADMKAMLGAAQYVRLVGDSADSPIAARRGLTNRINLGVFVIYTFGAKRAQG